MQFISARHCLIWLETVLNQWYIDEIFLATLQVLCTLLINASRNHIWMVLNNCNTYIRYKTTAILMIINGMFYF